MKAANLFLWYTVAVTRVSRARVLCLGRAALAGMTARCVGTVGSLVNSTYYKVGGVEECGCGDKCGGGCSPPRTVVVCTDSQEDFLCLFVKLVRRVGGVVLVTVLGINDDLCVCGL